MSDINILHRSEHNISRKDISQPALKVLYRLRSKGYWAFLVGGALRDLLRGKTPRDFDVATNAAIGEVKALFRNSKMIGKRFPIVHTYFGRDLVEVSSLKADGETNKYELLKADALQRDFTVNSIFYDINDFKVIDPLGAVAHVREGLVEPIGDVNEKFSEDPIRMLRAIKLVVKQGFSFGAGVEEAIRTHLKGWDDVGPGRRYEELTRILLDGGVIEMIEACTRVGLLERMWPAMPDLVERLGPEFFLNIGQTVPIHYSRGSFAKQTHTHLWFQIFVRAGLLDEKKSPDAIRKKFDAFIGTLGMPFRLPVIEALIGLANMRKRVENPLNGVSKEGRHLLAIYLPDFEPDLAPALDKATSPHAKKGRKPSRRRRPRRRKRKPSAR